MAAAYISPAAEGAKPSAAQPRHSGVRKTLENLIHLIFLLCGVVAVAFVLLISIYLILFLFCCHLWVKFFYFLHYFFYV